MNQVKSFVEKAANDTDLAQRVAASESPEDVVAIASEEGYDFSVEELQSASEEMYGEISEDDLENVAGGRNLALRQAAAASAGLQAKDMAALSAREVASFLVMKIGTLFFNF